MFRVPTTEPVLSRQVNWRALAHQQIPMKVMKPVKKLYFTLTCGNFAG